MRKALTRLLTLLLLTAAVTCQAQSDYPNKPIRLVVGYAPGASTDIVCRIFAEKLSLALGQAVVIENRTGAAGMISAQTVAHAPPDGYTLVAFNPDLAGIVPALYKTPPYDAVKDFAPVGRLMRNTGWILALNPSVPAKTFDDFVKLAKSNPALLNYGTYGIGSLPHLNFEALKRKLSIDMVHVPYKGGALSYQAAMAGDVQIVAGTSFVDLLKSGRLRPIVIGGNKRSPYFPDIPTLAELGLGDEIFGELYVAIVAPAGTPPAIVQRLSAEMKKIVAMPDVMERIQQFGDPAYASPQELATIIQHDANLYGALVKSLGLNTQ